MSKLLSNFGGRGRKSRAEQQIRATSQSILSSGSSSNVLNGTKSPPPQPKRSVSTGNQHLGKHDDSQAMPKLSNARNSASLMNITCPHCNSSAPALDFLIKHGNKESSLVPSVQQLQTALTQLDKIRTTLTKQLNDTKPQSVASPSVATTLSITLPQSGSQDTYSLSRLDEQGQRAYAYLTTHDNIVFKLTRVALMSPHDSATPDIIAEKCKQMSKRFANQTFMIHITSHPRLLTISTSASSGGKDAAGKGYRQSRSFTSIASAAFESDQTMLRIMFSNARGSFLLLFASEVEASMLMNIVNIIASNEDYNAPLSDQVTWAANVSKKGKRMGMWSPRFLVMRGMHLELYRSAENFSNGEECSQKFSLLNCDFSERRSDGREVKFKRKDAPASSKNTDDNIFLTVRLFAEIERDDFLNLCAQTLGEAIAKNIQLSKAALTEVDDDDESLTMEDSDNDDEKYDPRAELSSLHTGITPGSRLSPTGPTPGNGPFRGNRADTFLDDASEISSQAPDELGLVHSQSFRKLAGSSAFYQSAKQLQLVSDSIVEQHSAKQHRWLESLQHMPRMYGASHLKALDRLAKRRASDIDFIEKNFTGKEETLLAQSDENLQTYRLLDVLYKSMIGGAFLTRTLYIHKAIWGQNRVMLLNYEEKLYIFQRIQEALDKTFDKASIAWVQKDNWSNADKFHSDLVQCGKELEEAQSTLESYVNKGVSKAKKKGFGKFMSDLKDKSHGKVFDNQPYRDMAQQICSRASTIEMYYKYLSSGQVFNSNGPKLLEDIKRISRSLSCFGAVIFVDMKEFLKAYLRRGAKNLYE